MKLGSPLRHLLEPWVVVVVVSSEGQGRHSAETYVIKTFATKVELVNLDQVVSR